MAKISLNALRTRASTIDRAKLDATTDPQIESHKAEDGFADLPTPASARVVEAPKALRVRLGLTQPEMAAALRIPLGTWRNWEQGRVGLEPAAAALLTIVSSDPESALAALGLESGASCARGSSRPERNGHTRGTTTERASLPAPQGFAEIRIYGAG